MNDSLARKATTHLKNYVVTYMFIALSIVFVIISGMDINLMASQLLLRLNRNAFIVMALIIPIVAGMGINFSITIGAMAAQIGLLLTISWGVTGMRGILLAAAITLPLGLFFGFLIGTLLNKMKGQETIGSLILGYFANGAYQLLFLFIFGGIIPLSDKVTIVGATGVQNTLNLTGSVGLATAIDGILRVPFLTAVYVLADGALLVSLILYLRNRLSKKRFLIIAGIAAAMAVIFLLPPVANIFNGVHGREIRIPVMTWLIIGMLCLFNAVIMRTRLGQKFRAVGQSQTVANASGINVNRTRIIAIMISTVLAGWGQIIFMQSEGIGTFQTYAAHEQVGLYAGAAILVGGASIDRATNVQALIGTFLFHLLFIAAQSASSQLFGNAVVGEYFRAFMSYGVIALALILYAARNARQKKSNLMALAAESAAVKN